MSKKAGITDIIAFYDKCAKMAREDFIERIKELFDNPDWVEYLNKVVHNALEHFKNKVYEHSFEGFNGEFSEKKYYILDENLKSCATHVFNTSVHDIFTWITENVSPKGPDMAIAKVIGDYLTDHLVVLFKSDSEEVSYH